MDPGDRWILNYHRKSLTSGNWRRNPDGSGTTVLIGGVDGPDGRIYMVPLYDQGTGRTLTAKQAYKKWEPWIKKGVVPSDSTPQEHNARAHRLHSVLEKDASIFRPTAPKYDLMPKSIGTGQDQYPNALLKMLMGGYSPTINTPLK